MTGPFSRGPLGRPPATIPATIWGLRAEAFAAVQVLPAGARGPRLAASSARIAADDAGLGPIAVDGAPRRIALAPLIVASPKRQALAPPEMRDASVCRRSARVFWRRGKREKRSCVVAFRDFRPNPAPALPLADVQALLREDEVVMVLTSAT